MQSSLQRYFLLRINKLFNHLHDFELMGDEPSLHDFRVELKKLKSVIKFLKTIYPKQKFKKVNHLLGSIFQNAGEIREYQLLQQWLKKHELKNIVENYFPEEKIKSLISSFHQQSASYKTDLQEVIDRCNKYVQITNKILPEQYVTELNAQIEKLLHKHLSTKDWHELRKLIKKWMYASNWIVHEEKNKINSLFSYYNKLQETIGQWHDLLVIKETLHQKQIHLSAEIDIQKDLSKALEKLNHAIKYREKQVAEIISRQLITA
ncbi:MAG TPA: CHAD domain-containing protein [Chitinophagaceae bacterium]|nr:CHAD domain-containing protein [Chitinophagaceae bacterium]